MKQLNVYIGIGLLLLYSCSTPVIDLPETPEKLIVQSEFTPEEDLAIYFFKGFGMPGTEGESSVPDSLDVELYCEGKALELEKLEGAGIFYYRSSDLTYVPGQEFELRASIGGNEEVEAVKAKTIVPLKDSLLNMQLLIDTTKESGDWREIGLSLTFEMTTHNWDRYYELQITQEAEGKLMPPVDTLWAAVPAESLTLRQADQSLPAGVYWLSTRNSFLIDHFKLSDKKLSLPLKMNSNESSDLSRLKFTFRAHTQDGFAFIKSYDRLQSNYYTEYPVLVSNIQNGIGIFTAYAETQQLIDLKTR